MPKAQRSPLLLRLMARLGELEFEEGWIPPEKGEHGHIYGLWLAEGKILINPIPHVVDTILHELCHELKPNMSELGIRSLTGRLFKQLSDQELQTVYWEYRRKVDGD